MAKLGGFQFFSPKIRQDQEMAIPDLKLEGLVLEGEVFQDQADQAK